MQPVNRSTFRLTLNIFPSIVFLLLITDLTPCLHDCYNPKLLTYIIGLENILMKNLKSIHINCSVHSPVKRCHYCHRGPVCDSVLGLLDGTIKMTLCYGFISFRMSIMNYESVGSVGWNHINGLTLWFHFLPNVNFELLV